MLNSFHILREIAWRILAIAPLPLLVACAALRPTRVPMEHQLFRTAEQPQPTLLVMLPGIRDTEQHFIKHGFVDAVQQHGLAVDVVAADAHLGYYRRQSLESRLIEDIIEPARARGTTRIVLFGTSLGGLGSLIMAKNHPDMVDGLILLAPYIGDDKVIDEIRDGGGPAAWRPGEIAANDFARDLWLWLRQADLPPTVVACGANDRLIETSRLLAELLPPESLVVEPGGHDWKTWRSLWRQLLAGEELEAAGIL